MSDPVPGDAQVAQDFAATRALAQRPDPGKAFDALFPPAAAAATAMTPPAAAPIDPSQPIAGKP